MGKGLWGAQGLHGFMVPAEVITGSSGTHGAQGIAEAMSRAQEASITSGGAQGRWSRL